jgi:DNA helicase-2/ATP-dependent DNA helicase PcrA
MNRDAARPRLDLDRELNADQVEAVTHGLGPQLVLAGAGTGKTRVITYRIAWLIEQGVEPWRIAAVTFTNKAANEMKERVHLLVGPDGRQVFVGTFHRFALRLLRRYGERVGLPSGFNVLDADDQMTLIKRVLEAERIDTSVFSPRSVLSRISAAKNRLLGPAEFEASAEGFWEHKIAQAYRAYQQSLRQSAAADFDDLIRQCVLLLQKEQELGERMRRRLRYLLVDEFQDTNHAQQAMITALVGSGGNLTAVGDEDQGIYRWRGADLDNILEFERAFEAATVRKLERNYRSTQTILDASGQLVANNRRRRGKRLWTDAGAGHPIELYRAQDEGDEAVWIAERLQAIAAEERLADTAVLMRTNAQTRAIEDELLRRKLPYHLVAGTRFYERSEVKDVIAYLRVLRNPRDNLSLRRILNVPTRGIGRATQEELYAQADQLGHAIWDVLELDHFGRFAARAAKALRGFRDLIIELRHLGHSVDLATLLEALLERTGIAKMYDRPGDDDARARLENLDELLSATQSLLEDLGMAGRAAMEPVSAGAEVDDGGEGGVDASLEKELPTREGGGVLPEETARDPLSAFLDYVALVSDTDALAQDRGVSLMTLHSAKGLEFGTVFLVGLEDGLLPHFNAESEDDFEEERRLLYVGMTRARRRLLLTTCARRRIAGRYQDRSPSAFLTELPLHAIEGSESRSLWERSPVAPVYSFFDRRVESASSPRVVRREGVRLAGPRAGITSGRSDGATRIDFRQGAGVRHPTLGKGVILEVVGQGDDAKLTVFFDRAGKRRLIAKYAGLEPADT